MIEATKKIAKLAPSLCRFGHSNPALQAFLAKHRNNRVPVKYMDVGEFVRAEI